MYTTGLLTAAVNSYYLIYGCCWIKSRHTANDVDILLARLWLYRGLIVYCYGNLIFGDFLNKANIQQTLSVFSILATVLLVSRGAVTKGYEGSHLKIK